MDRPPDAGDQSERARAHLSPDMASFRGLVLAFVRQYIEEWQQSPSYGEIAGALESNRTRVRRAIRSLESDSLILRTAGPRGLRLPDQRENAVRMLRELGYNVDDRAAAVTNPPLLSPPALDYPAAQKSAGDLNEAPEDS